MKRRRTLQFGPVLGIRIELDWSLGFVFALIAANLGLGVFPEWHPDWRPWVIWACAFGAALSFVASVLAHEMAHALVGRALGIPIRRITLFFLGGMAHLEEQPKQASGELVMALAGPALSLGLGVVCTLGGLALVPRESWLEAFTIAGPLATLLLWLGPVNVVLGVFNLLPGFPLDGGRVLRALLWGASGRRTWATKWAARSGRALAWLMVAAGVLGVAAGATAQGIWIGVLGVFLVGAARLEYDGVVRAELLEGVAVRDVMRRFGPVVGPELTVRALGRELLLHNEVRDVLVANMDGEPCGLIGVDDLEGADAAARVADAMRGLDSLPTVRATDPAEKLLAAGRAAIVLDRWAHPVGVADAADVIRFLRIRPAVADDPAPRRVSAPQPRHRAG